MLSVAYGLPFCPYSFRIESTAYWEQFKHPRYVLCPRPPKSINFCAGVGGTRAAAAPMPASAPAAPAEHPADQTHVDTIPSMSSTCKAWRVISAPPLTSLSLTILLPISNAGRRFPAGHPKPMGDAR